MEMAVKLNQSLDTLYEMDFMEYSMMLNIIKRKIEEHNKNVDSANGDGDIFTVDSSKKYNIGLPDNLR